MGTRSCRRVPSGSARGSIVPTLSDAYAVDRARKWAQRHVPADKCSACGTTKGRLDRHHPNILLEPHRVEIVCRKCHPKVDQRDGCRLPRFRSRCRQCSRRNPQHHAKDRKYCSRSCMAAAFRMRKRLASDLAAGRPLRVCVACGSKTARKRNRFCSRACWTRFAN